MLVRAIFLSVNFLLYLPISNFNIVEIRNCKQLSSCSKQKVIIGQNSDNLSNSSTKKTCKHEGKTYQEGEEIQKDGMSLVCKNGKFVPRD